MSSDIIFNGGDEVRQPFVITVAEGVTDLTGCIVTAVVHNPYQGNTILTQENGGLIITDLDPPVGDPQGLFILSSLMTAGMPINGAFRPFVRLVVVNSEGVTMSTDLSYLVRLV